MKICKVEFVLIFGLLLSLNAGMAQSSGEGSILGTLNVDQSWARTVYLSHIPTFDEIHSMSNDMVISEAEIDSLGNFEIDFSFLPEKDNLFRLHLVKKENSKYSLTIGGKDENHMFFLANKHSTIKFSNTSIQPPFRHLIFENSEVNENFYALTNMVFQKDSLASISNSAKRKFVREKLKEELKDIADTTSIPLISLYALYNFDYKSDYANNSSFYAKYADRWSDQNNKYFNTFKSSIKINRPSFSYLKTMLIGLLLLFGGFALGKYNFGRHNKLKKLSVQERKIYAVLSEGATNQEIADQFNIGVNTVKSHVSSILAKLKVKSRKEIFNL